MKETVSILGSVYKIEHRSQKDDKRLKGLSGYCDAYHQLIVIRNDWKDEVPSELINEIARHVIVHAFFFESGLWDNSNEYGAAWANNEEMIDWIAIQGPKIYRAWEEAGVI